MKKKTNRSQARLILILFPINCSEICNMIDRTGAKPWMFRLPFIVYWAVKNEKIKRKKNKRKLETLKLRFFVKNVNPHAK